MAVAAEPGGGVKRSRSLEFLPPDMSELRVVLLGSTWSQRNSVENFIHNNFNTEPLSCTRNTSQFRSKHVTVINTPDLLSPTEDKLTEFLTDCARVSDPGPHVFLLVLHPEDFNQEHKQTLCRILETYNDQSFDQCLILIKPRKESSGLRESHMENPTLKEMIIKCRYRHLKMSDIDRSELLTRLGQVVKDNNGKHVTYEVFKETTSPASSCSAASNREIKDNKDKCITTVKELHTNLKALRDLADGLERVHEATTIGSLAGGVIGAVGGITSIVGVVLAPFTLGTSLIVTGVGVGVSALGGLTAGVSTITKMVNESIDRKAVHSIIKEFEQKISAVVTWLQEISYSLQTISSQYPQTCEGDGNFREEKLKRLALGAGRGLSGVTELIRLARVVNIGKIAAQVSRTVRVAQVATGILSGLFIAVDLFFIAMDAKEIHNMKQDRAAKKRGAVSISEIMKFILSVREAANSLEKVLAELESIIAEIPLFPEEILE